MKKLLSLNFSDFWPGFEKENNYFYQLLNQRYQLKLSDEPEFLIYSAFGNKHKTYSNAVKVFYTGENVLPDFTECDYALSFAYINTLRNYRFPYYGWCYHSNENYLYGQDVLKRFTVSRDICSTALKEKEFCSFVVSNSYAKDRIDFFKKLSKYRKVSSGGKLLNNIGTPVQDKPAFLRKHKFNIAFENSCSPGYTTEKLVDAYLSEAVPIYWGNKLVDRDFNKKAFIHVNDFRSFDEAIERIIELDNNDNLLIEMLNQPLFTDQKLNSYVKQENVIQFLDSVITHGRNRSLVLAPDYWMKLQAYKTKQTLQKLKQTLRTSVSKG